LAEVRKPEQATWNQGKINSSAQARAVLVGTVARVIALAFAPRVALAADNDWHEDRAEVGVNQMHAKRKISSAQEARCGNSSFHDRASPQNFAVPHR